VRLLACGSHQTGPSENIRADTAQLAWVLKMSDIPLFGIAQVGTLLVAMAAPVFMFSKRINLALLSIRKCYFSGEK
jgi:hypothetical protein